MSRGWRVALVFAALLPIVVLLFRVGDRGTAGLVSVLAAAFAAIVQSIAVPARVRALKQARRDSELLSLAKRYGQIAGVRVEDLVVIPGHAGVPALTEKRLEVSEAVYELPEAQRTYAIVRGVFGGKTRLGRVEALAITGLISGLAGAMLGCDLDPKRFLGWLAVAALTLLICVPAILECQARRSGELDWEALVQTEDQAAAELFLHGLYFREVLIRHPFLEVRKEEFKKLLRNRGLPPVAGQGRGARKKRELADKRQSGSSGSKRLL